MSARNIVSITYKQMETHPKIEINNEEISRYMGLSDHIHNDVFLWVDKLYTSMDEEINDEYDIEICGHKFHYLIVKSLMHSSSFCRDVRYKEFTAVISVDEKYAFACRMIRELDKTFVPPRLVPCKVQFCIKKNACSLAGLGFMKKPNPQK